MYPGLRLTTTLQALRREDGFTMFDNAFVLSLVLFAVMSGLIALVGLNQILIQLGGL